MNSFIIQATIKGQNRGAEKVLCQYHSNSSYEAGKLANMLCDGEWQPGVVVSITSASEIMPHFYKDCALVHNREAAFLPHQIKANWDYEIEIGNRVLVDNSSYRFIGSVAGVKDEHITVQCGNWSATFPNSQVHYTGNATQGPLRALMRTTQDIAKGLPLSLYIK